MKSFDEFLNENENIDESYKQVDELLKLYKNPKDLVDTLYTKMPRDIWNKIYKEIKDTKDWE